MDQHTSDNTRVLRGILYVGFFIFVGKLFGALREVFIASRFGVSGIVDSYTLSQAVVYWIPTVWISVVNAIYVPLIHKLPIGERPAFDQRLMALVAMVGLLGTVLILLIINLGFPYIFNGLSDDGLHNLTAMSLGMTPIVMIALFSAHYSALLLAQERHVNTLADIAPSLVLIIFVLLWPRNYSVTGLFIFGMLCGAACQVFVLIYFCRAAGLSIALAFNRFGWVWRSIKNALGLMLISQAIASFVDPVVLYFAASLGDGNVSVYGYANKIIALAIGLGATAAGRAVLPVISSSQGSLQERKKLALRWGLILLATGACASALLWGGSFWAVKIIFERGAFTPENTRAVSEVVKFGAIQLPFVFCNVVLAQFFASQQRYRVLLISSILAIILTVIFGFLLVDIYALRGLMLAKSMMLICITLYFLAELYKTTQETGK